MWTADVDGFQLKCNAVALQKLAKSAAVSLITDGMECDKHTGRLLSPQRVRRKIGMTRNVLVHERSNNRQQMARARTRTRVQFRLDYIFNSKHVLCMLIKAA